MEELDEVLSHAEREFEREFKRDQRPEMMDLMEALRRSVEAARRHRERGYKVGEAAEVIGVHRNTVRGWIERGLLRASRIGMGDRGDFLIPFSEVERARQAHAVSSEADPLTPKQIDAYKAIVRAKRGAKPRDGLRAAPDRRRKAAG